MTKDQYKTKKQLIDDLRLLRRRLAEKESLAVIPAQAEEPGRKVAPILGDGAGSAQVEHALRLIVAGTYSASGQEFFHSLVKCLAAAIGVKFAFVSEVGDETDRKVRLISIWTGANFGENFEYDIRDTPCENVVGRQLAWYPKDVRGLFPKDVWLTENAIESYLAIPLFHTNGAALGHLGVMHVESLDHPQAASILKIFASRAAAELQRRQVENSLRHSHTALRNLTVKLHTTRENERAAISREIHNGLGQSLTGLKLDASWLMDELPKNETKLLERTRSMISGVNSLLETVHQLAFGLRPAIPDDLGLEAALEAYAHDFTGHTGCKCRVDVKIEELAPDVDRDLAVYRVLQESLSNVARHAEASLAEISLRTAGGELVLEVRDDGRGISNEEKASAQSLGLIGMREWARGLGGQVCVEQRVEGGTLVTLRVPLPSAREESPGDARTC